MTLAQVRKIIGSKGKRSWYYESTSTDSTCDDGYWTDGHYEPTETWIDGYYDGNGNWVDGQIEYGETWVDGEWVDGACWDEDLTTVYSDHSWKNDKGGYVDATCPSPTVAWTPSPGTPDPSLRRDDFPRCRHPVRLRAR